VPWDERAWHPTGVIEFAKELTVLAKKLKPYGLFIGFHNHEQEFNDFRGSTYWDYIAQNTQNSVLLQLDVGWVNYAGKDPISYVKKYAGRTLTTHYKIRTKDGVDTSPILGQDNYNWAELIKINIAIGGTKWLVVEQEEYPKGMSPLESVAQSKLGLDKIISSL
jgi:sugar phosphate isomerase/epimerase